MHRIRRSNAPETGLRGMWCRGEVEEFLFSYNLLLQQQGGSSLTCRAGERWVRRLKVKPRMDMRFAKCLWKATLTNVEPGIIYVLRLELSSSAHAETH